MTNYQRIFGAGPRGAFFSLVTLVVAAYLASGKETLTLHGNPTLANVVLMLSGILGAGLIFWSLRSLPPGDRGRYLVTGGAYRYFRHPLYAAFLSSTNFGVAIFLDHWFYLIWACALHPMWHVNVRSEEALMAGAFPQAYPEYARRTGRFFPRIAKIVSGDQAPEE